MQGKTQPLSNVLVPTDWVARNATNSAVRVVEVDVDTAAYGMGHVRGASNWNWTTDLCEMLTRDIVPMAKCEELLRRTGIDNNTTIVLYGDNNNWFAAWAFWQLKIYGHEDVRIMDGGRRKWLTEGRELVSDKPTFTPTAYKAKEPDLSLRASMFEVRQLTKDHSGVLIDARSPQEFNGEILAPPGVTETAQRGGHIPGAKNMPWNKACNDDGTFKRPDELITLFGALGIDPKQPPPVIVYHRTGERSSHTWFVLKYLLGIPEVKNYDGSWTEWGNMIGAPVER
jgi:thiosulfate/3-mercaptopyruvate sulfurtransferase